MSISRHLKESDDLLIRTLALGFSRGHVINGHSHSWSQVVFASQGVMQVDALGSRWMVPPLRCLWVPANVSHTIRIMSETTLRTIYIPQHSSNGFTSDCTVLNVSPLLRELILETTKLGMLRRSNGDQSSLASVLLSYLKKAEEMPLKLTLPTDERAIRLADMITAHPERKINLTDSAKNTGASPRTLERLFKNETGMSVGAWRRQARLMMAIRLLCEAKSVHEVAFLCGFASSSAFVMAFREGLGSPPGHYILKYSDLS